MSYRFTYAEAVSRGWISPEEAQAMQQGVSVKSHSSLSERSSKKRSTTQKPRKSDVEGQEQMTLIAWFRSTYPQYADLLIHIPNGGYRKNAFEGWRLKQQGVRAGVSDLFLPVARNGCHGLWIEFKAAPPFDAVVSDAQKEWIGLMSKEGYAAYICKGVTEAADVLKGYLSAGVSSAFAAKQDV